ncbi:GNAT family N-acetyltransferase [Mycetocola tolaasinivorans]|uniref:GNAT family N-acetyltransferase n=1 Tax=Mycetocola tolaasinivorans TaxID=76635 RepID=A0A3L7A7T1_9MICO|nr:GNAT family N-acetyltransferase [Mycetocola tolaasinivorans]RLP76436.1 GNAT family N-acetyltransferase [Mycetocola tolaasinivorans]
MSVQQAVTVIRLARPGEYEAIDALIRAAYAHDYGEKGHATDPMQFAATRAENYDVWVAEGAEGALLGSITTRRAGVPPLHEDVLDSELDLRILGVSPDARRQGIAAALMTHVIGHARETGFQGVFLKTGPNMTGAHALYEHLGFVRAPKRDGLWIGGKKILDLFTFVYPLGTP